LYNKHPFEVDIPVSNKSPNFIFSYIIQKDLSLCPYRVSTHNNKNSYTHNVGWSITIKFYEICAPCGYVNLKNDTLSIGRKGNMVKICINRPWNLCCVCVWGGGGWGCFQFYQFVGMWDQETIEPNDQAKTQNACLIH
jgi:hypothetical protein